MVTQDEEIWIPTPEELERQEHGDEGAGTQRAPRRVRRGALGGMRVADGAVARGREQDRNHDGD